MQSLWSSYFFIHGNLLHLRHRTLRNYSTYIAVQNCIIWFLIELYLPSQGLHVWFCSPFKIVPEQYSPQVYNFILFIDCMWPKAISTVRIDVRIATNQVNAEDESFAFCHITHIHYVPFSCFLVQQNRRIIAAGDVAVFRTLLLMGMFHGFAIDSHCNIDRGDLKFYSSVWVAFTKFTLWRCFLKNNANTRAMHKRQLFLQEVFGLFNQYEISFLRIPTVFLDFPNLPKTAINDVNIETGKMKMN